MVINTAPSNGKTGSRPASGPGGPVAMAAPDLMLLDALPDAVLVFDGNERLVAANAAFGAAFPGLRDFLSENVDAEQLFGAMTVYLAPVSVQGMPALLDERLRRLRQPGQRWRQRLSSGAILEIEDRALADGGRLTCYRDVTRQANEHSLLNQRLAAVEAMQDGILIADPEGRLIYANQALASLLGADEASGLMGRAWLALVSPDSAEHLRDEVLPALPNIRHWQGEIDGAAAGGGRIPLEISMTQLEEEGVIVVARSLAEQKAQEAERARLQRQFFESQKMEALGNLAGGIAHDFNNIISCIMGYATFLSEDLEGTEAADFAESILTASERARSLVGQILSYSRRAPTEKKRVCPAAILRETAGLLRATLSPRIELKVSLPDRELETVGDATQIGQVLMNLAVNARDALPDSAGTIELSLAVRGAVTPDTDGPPPVTVGEPACPPEETGRWLAITVRDTGQGMPRDLMERIFDPFFTTKGESGGTGLGLAAVHGIVLEHSGALIAESAPGLGSTFTVLLPEAGPNAP